MISEKRIKKLIGEIESLDTLFLEPETAREALELSVAKWHPIRGSNRGRFLCGLCAWYEDCEDGCPMVIDGKSCDDEGHMWKEWHRARDVVMGKGLDELAEPIYQHLVAVYEAL